MSIYCYFHSSDFDGQCSGALIKQAYPEAILRPINYGQEVDTSEFSYEDTVFMVDFGLQPWSKMEELNKVCKLVWIDHHATAINEHDKSDELFFGLRRVGNAACELVWEYLNGNQDYPRAVYYIGRHDVWDHNNVNTLPFQYGMRTLPETDPSTEAGMNLWRRLFEDGDVLIKEIIDTGVLSQRVNAQRDKRIMSSAFAVEFEGLKCIAVNSPAVNSISFESVWDPTKYDAMLAFAYRGDTKMWTVSMYSDKPGVDVGVVCKKMGGGGHKGAAGFQLPHAPAF